MNPARVGSRRFPRAVACLAVFGLVAAVACGDDTIPQATSAPGPGDPGTSACATPQEGCPCNVPGTSVECGAIKSTDGDTVTCSMGLRTCGAGAWGACSPTTVATKHLPGARVAALATTPTACPDPCDPYCNQYADNAAGLADAGDGVIVADGGLTIDPQADGGDVGGGGVISVGFTSNPAGVTNCSPDRNIVGTNAARACTPPGLSQCQQDFHCDPSTNTCLWNAATGYKDPTCNGVDLTIGAPCGPSGSVAPSLPVCNRGTAALPPGSLITLHETQSPSPPNHCTNLGVPTCTYTMPVSLVPGQCVTLRYCQNSPGAKFLTVNAGVPGAAFGAGGPAVVECANGGQRCQNNGAYMKTDSSPGCATCQTCNTRLTGKVFDPSGTTAFGPAATGANNVPLANVIVYQPSATLVPLADGVTCDTCESLQTPYQTATVTDASGSFTLDNVSPGASGTVPIVVQSGRWRRKINVTSNDLVGGGALAACALNTVKDGALRMPRSTNLTTDNPTSQAGLQVNIPKTALVLGEREGLECWVRKIGIADNEMRPRLASGNTARFQLFRTNGSAIHDVNGPACTTSNVASTCSLNTTSSERRCTSSRCAYYPTYTSTNQIGSRNFFANEAVMDEFSGVLLPCDSDVLQGSSYTTWKANLSSYLRSGGRVFMNHLTGEEFLRDGPSPLNGGTVTTWQNWADPSNGSLSYARGWIPIPTPSQATFSAWMSNVGGSPDGAQWMRSDDPKRHALAPGAASTEWVAGRSDNAWNGTRTNDDYALSFSFETGVSGGATTVGRDSSVVNCGVQGGTGRVIFNGMHVSQARMPNYPTRNNNLFPTSCSTSALTSEEKALEYQFFQLSACTVSGAPPLPLAPAPPLATVDFVRDYEAACAIGTRPQWQAFSWQAIVPTTTTRIELRAATAATQAALPASPPGPAPTTAGIGVADATVPAGPSPAPQWATLGQTVEQRLVAETGTTSKRWLRVYMRFVPDNGATPYRAPSLTNWRQAFACVPYE